MQRFVRFWVGIYYSLPVQLLVSQLINHRSILLFWLFLFLLVTGNVLNSFGIPQLFLEPEYNGQVSAVGMFIVGISLGLFTLAYQLTCYILDGYRFLFLTLLRRPVRVFIFNNSALPLAFWITYGVKLFQFQSHNPRLHGSDVMWLIGSLALGAITVITVSLSYFFYTNKTLYTLGERVIRGVQNPVRIMRRAQQSIEFSTRVDSYLASPWRYRRLPAKPRGELKPILKVLNQNHGNALVVMVFFFVLFLGLSFIQQNERLSALVQLPAAASFLIVLAIFVMLVGFLTFWFRRMGLLVIIALALVLYFVNSYRPLVGDNYAFGLNYTQPQAAYNDAALERLTTDQKVKDDIQHTEGILSNWLVRYYLHKPERWINHRKPKLLLLAVSGGGLRSATWVMRCLQAADSSLDGHLGEHLRLITGASGGMMGAAYYRELMWQTQNDPKSHIKDSAQVEAISLDLLNRISTSLISGLLLPAQRFGQGDKMYEKDRGYAFEQQFKLNTKAFEGRRLADYREPEEQALIPMMIFTPTILNDGRQLFISAQPVAYLTKRASLGPDLPAIVPGVEFSRLFAANDADSLYFTTAIRMSATFPYALPPVELPSLPTMEVMDAGIVDNYGVNAAAKYIYALRRWIEANTSGVVLLQIRDSPRTQPVDASMKPGQGPTSRTLLSQIMNVFGGTYASLASSKDFQSENLLAYTQSLLQVPFEVLELQYLPASSFEQAALNFHLTRREKEDIVASIHKPENRKTLERLRQLMEQ